MYSCRSRYHHLFVPSTSTRLRSTYRVFYILHTLYTCLHIYSAQSTTTILNILWNTPGISATPVGHHNVTRRTGAVMASFPTLQRQFPNQRQAPNSTSYWPEAHTHHHAGCPKWEVLSSFAYRVGHLHPLKSLSVSLSLSVSPPPTTLLDDTPNKRSAFFSCRPVLFLSECNFWFDLCVYAGTFVAAFRPFRWYSRWRVHPAVHVGKSSCQTAHNHYFFLQSQIFPSEHWTTYQTVTEYWSDPYSTKKWMPLRYSSSIDNIQQ